ncbi:hypothetical protein ABNO07_003514 [Salmonella enterica subsp. enterica serovar Bareilly]
MKKIIIASALLAFAASANASLNVKICEYQDTVLPAGTVIKSGLALVGDLGDHFAVVFGDTNYNFHSEGFVSPKLTSFDDHISSGTVNGVFYSQMNHDNYVVGREGSTTRSIIANCGETDDKVEAAFVDAFKEMMPELVAEQKKNKANHVKEDAQLQEEEIATQGGEFEMRGDIARPEYKGANTFTGKAYDAQGNFIEEVKLVRDAEDNITLIFSGNDKRTYKKDSMMNGTPGTYGEPRSATEFYIDKGVFFDVTETKVVK